MKLVPLRVDRLLKQDRNKHHCQGHFLQQLRYHFTCVNGSTSKPGEYDRHSFEASKKMIRLLRHDRSVLREEDGAVDFKILAPIFASQFESSPHWSLRTWLSYLQRGGGPKKRFQYCLDPHSAETILYLRAIQDHSVWNQIDPALQDNVLLPSDFAEYIYHVGSSHDMHSIIQSRLIPGGKDIKRGRQTSFFTAVNPTHTHLHKQRDHNVTKPRKKGLTFYQTRSNAIILHNTLPAACIEKVVSMSSKEVLKTQMYESPRSPRKVVLKPAWNEGRTDTTSIEERASNRPFQQERWDLSRWNRHSTVEQEDHTRKKLIHQFETHPNREALNADLKQNHAYNSFSTKSKNMIHSMGNVSTSKCVRYLLKFSALSVWHTGRQGSCIVHAEPACISQRKRANWTGIDLIHYQFQNTW